MNELVKQTSVADGQRLGVSTRTISISALVTFLIAYSHFFGMSYRKSFLEGIGFESVNINLSPDESIYFAIHGFKSSINQLMSFDLFAFQANQLMAGLVFSLVIITIWAVKKSNIRPIVQQDKPERGNKFYLFLDQMTDSLPKSIGLSFISLFAGYILQVVITIVIAVLLITLWFLMALGIAAGYKDGAALIEKPICYEFDWTTTEKNRMLGCRQLQLKGSDLVKGVYVHKDNNANYFLSNHGTYEVNSKNEVISFRPINIRPEPFDKQTEKEKE
jgi:hypothetical protein